MSDAHDNRTNENPYVFPHIRNRTDQTNSGLRLRDYLAGQAIIGLCTVMTDEQGEAILNRGLTANTHARVAYEIADAMLEARSTK